MQSVYQNYIFDLYGTLVDLHTEENSPSLWKKMARLYALQGAFYLPRELKKEYMTLVSQEEEKLAKAAKRSRDEIEIQLEKVFGELFLKKGVKPTKAQIQFMGLAFRNESLRYIRLFDGVNELLERLHADGKGVYLLSNAQRMFTEPEMRMLGLYDKFDGILYSSDAGVKKPSSAFFGMLTERYQLKKEECVMVGNDCVADVSGAHVFGMDSMYVHTDQSTPFEGKLPSDCRRLSAIGDAYTSDKEQTFCR